MADADIANYLDPFTGLIEAHTPGASADLDTLLDPFTGLIEVATTPPPVNDDFANYLVIDPDIPVTGNTRFATSEAGEDSYPGTGSSLWYAFNLAAESVVTLDLSTSTGYGNAFIYVAVDPMTPTVDALIQVGGPSWPDDPIPHSDVLPAGMYFVRVGGYFDDTIPNELTVLMTFAPPSADLLSYLSNFDSDIQVTSEPAVNVITIQSTLDPFDGLIEVTTTESITEIELPSIDGATTPPGPADVELFDPDSFRDIDLPSIDGASTPPGVILDHFPVIEIPYLPIVTAKLYDRFGTLLSDLDNAYGINFQDPFNDVGSGSISMPFDDPDASLLAASTEVRCYLYGELVYSWEIEQDPKVNPIDEGEESKEEVVADGPGRVGLFARARVYPYKGVAGQLMGQHRLYSFASPDFPNIDGWIPAVQGLRQDEIDPVRHSTIEYTTISSITDIPDAVDIIPAAAPLGWMVPTAYWIWGTTDTLEVGFCYFRGQFTLTAPLSVVIAATADNLWTLYLDGNPIMGETGPETNWQERKEVKLDLPAGTYQLAAAVENISWPGPAEFNPAGFLCAVYTINTDDDTLQSTIYVTDNTWTVLPYPSVEPGWTPGQILIDAVSEAQARGGLLGFTLGFTAFADSSGSPWIGSGDVVGSYVPGFSVPIGASVLDMLNALTEQGWIDYRMQPGGKILQCFSQGNGNVNTGVDLVQTGSTVTQNIVSQVFEPQGPPVTRMLVKWSAGFFELNDAGTQATYGDYEGYLTIDAPDETEARRQAQRSFDDLIHPQTSIVMEIDPATTLDRPYLAFAVGDLLTIPDVDGNPVDKKLLSITVDETDMGRPGIALEFVARVLTREREQFKLIQLLGRGIAGNTKIRNALNETTSTSHG